MVNLIALLDGKYILSDGKQLPLSTLDSWEKVDRYVRSYWELTGTLPCLEIQREVPEQLSPPVALSVISNDNIPITPLPAKPQLEESNNSSWTVRAWMALGRPSTGDEMYYQAVSMGYRSEAENPIGAFKRAIRENPKFFQFAIADNRAVIWGLKGITPETPHHILSEFKKIVSDKPDTSTLAHRVLSRNGNPLRWDTLIDSMIEAGWNNTSPNRVKRKNSLRAALRMKPDVFSVLGDGFVGLTDWSSNDGNEVSLGLDDE